MGILFASEEESGSKPEDLENFLSHGENFAGSFLAGVEWLFPASAGGGRIKGTLAHFARSSGSIKCCIQKNSQALVQYDDAVSSAER